MMGGDGFGGVFDKRGLTNRHKCDDVDFNLLMLPVEELFTLFITIPAYES